MDKEKRESEKTINNGKMDKTLIFWKITMLAKKTGDNAKELLMPICSFYFVMKRSSFFFL